MSPESDDEDGSTTLAVLGKMRFKPTPKQRAVGDQIRDIRAKLRECQQAYEKIAYSSSQERRREGWQEAYAAAEQAQHMCFDLKDMFGLE